MCVWHKSGVYLLSHLRNLKVDRPEMFAFAQSAVDGTEVPGALRFSAIFGRWNVLHRHSALVVAAGSSITCSCKAVQSWEERKSLRDDKGRFSSPSLCNGRIFPRSSSADILQVSLTRNVSCGPLLCHITTSYLLSSHPRNVSMAVPELWRVATQILHYMAAPKQCHMATQICVTSPPKNLVAQPRQKCVMSSHCHCSILSHCTHNCVHCHSRTRIWPP